MSHIFDALRRSESERNGAEPPALSSITELLQSTEVHMQREPGALVHGPDVAELAGDLSPFSRKQSDASLSSEKRVTVEEPWNVFDQFETLQISPSPLNRLVSVTAKESPAAEAFRLASVRLKQRKKQQALKRLLITGTVPGEGKTFAAANLACTLASGAREKVLLIDGDMRRPSLPKLFEVEEKPGIADWLQGKQDFAASIYRLEPAGIWFLPVGNAPANPLELLQSAQLPPLMLELSTFFDWIIVDSPPVLPLADTSVWARLADGILLVTRRGTTEKRKLKRGIEALDPAKMLGALINFSNTPLEEDYYYYRSKHGERD